MDKKLKLTIELVPQTIWFKNIRSSLKQEDWDKIRKNLLKYCGLDTEAMVWIVEKLKKII